MPSLPSTRSALRESLARHPGYVDLLIEVSDRGKGIPPALVPRLFTRGGHGGKGSEGHGLGLGLYIAERVMSLHKGSIELVRSGPDGTTMRLAITQNDSGE